MIVKLLEIRDRATCISVSAIKFNPTTKPEKGILRWSGFHPNDFVFLVKLTDAAKFHYDPRAWNDRTMESAHLWIEKHFDELRSGDLVDVEVILGEKKKPKKSQFK